MPLLWVVIAQTELRTRWLPTSEPWRKLPHKYFKSAIRTGKLLAPIPLDVVGWVLKPCSRLRSKDTLVLQSIKSFWNVFRVWIGPKAKFSLSLLPVIVKRRDRLGNDSGWGNWAVPEWRETGTGGIRNFRSKLRCRTAYLTKLLCRTAYLSS